VNLIIYHESCVDGWLAAYLMFRSRKEFFPNDETTMLSAQYGDDPPCFPPGANVYILDFSYPRDVMVDINARAGKVVVLDHHKTAEKECKGLDFCTFDMTKSGAMLTWEYLVGEGYLPDIPGTRLNPNFIVQYVQDRDLWEWKLPDSKEVNAALRSYRYSIEDWDKLIHTSKEWLISEGRALLRYRSQMVETHVNRAKEIELAGHKILAVCCTTDIVSEVAGELAKNRDFGVCYFDIPGYRVYSLRSRGDFDVAEFAKKFGGGGHKGAAGFRLPRP
jgi:oligoribonuclease NrnB/cAMP/cGMP phosphodiesterase (DHH superfamily)